MVGFLNRSGLLGILVSCWDSGLLNTTPQVCFIIEICTLPGGKENRGSFGEEKVELVIVTVLNFILGNLLNSLMGTGEDDDTEDGQEDSSPIELDWMWLSLGAV